MLQIRLPCLIQIFSIFQSIHQPPPCSNPSKKKSPNAFTTNQICNELLSPRNFPLTMSYISRQQRRVIYIIGCLSWFTLTTHPFMIPWVPSSRSSCQRNLAEENDVPPYFESFMGNSTNYIEDLKVVERPPIPIMPSDLFQKMALSQLEVLANSLTRPGTVSESKVESMALYLPQENVNTGQLEFTPVVLYPDPKSEVRDKHFFCIVETDGHIIYATKICG